MRKYLHIDLSRRVVHIEHLEGEEILRAGRYRIARTLLAAGVARVDPLSPANPLIFSAGPLAGTTFSSANRLSVGCKSPLTGGVKESNAGGTFALAMGHLGIAGFTLSGAADRWTVLRIRRDGSVGFDPADPYLGKGASQTAELLRRTYGDEVSLAVCGPVGEYRGLLAGIGITDREGRPSRMAGRGGVGAVMGAKNLKAIVIDLDKAPEMTDRPAFNRATQDYAAKLGEQPAVKNFHDFGTAMVADITNYMGGLPVRNFSAGQMVDRNVEPLLMGGEAIRRQQLVRNGQTAHACMPGCLIQCSNVYVDETGKELVAPIEYETLGLVGSNCGIGDPDAIARLNAAANDLGIDTIEFGATMAMLMGSGHAAFGDTEFIDQALGDLRQGNERGRLLAQGCARVGAHYGITRIPAIKKQALSAYDPRVIEVTGITMRTSAQGADHTAGNLFLVDCTGKSLEELTQASFAVQINTMIADSLGLCMLARSVNDANRALLAEAIHACVGVRVEPGWFEALAREGLRLERQFNREAGFTEADDDLPSFLADEPLPPSNKVARFTSAELNARLEQLLGT
jgi:aldehyde:ferredoxin oxidoreductase